MLFAIFKNKNHVGNQKGATSEEAIKNYIIESMLEEFVNDKDFLAKYSAIKAINGIHHHFIANKEILN